VRVPKVTGPRLVLALCLFFHVAKTLACENSVLSFLEKTFRSAEAFKFGSHISPMDPATLEGGHVVLLPFQSERGEMLPIPGMERFYFVGKVQGTKNVSYQLMDFSGTLVRLEAPKFYQNALAETRSLPTYQPGEWVQIAEGGSAVNPVRELDGRMPQWWARNSKFIPFPILGRYQGRSESGELLVEIEIDRLWIGDEMVHEKKRVYRVRETLAFKLNATDSSEILKKLAPFENLPMEYRIQQKVRFRGADGRIQLGTIVAEKDSSFVVESSSRVQQTLRPSQVFPVSASLNVETPLYELPWLTEKLSEGVSPILRKILDAGARLSAYRQFLEKSERERLDLLTRFVQLLLPWQSCARHASNFGLTSFDDLLTSGVGVCRHNALLLVMILREAGYDAELVTAYHGNFGHAFVLLKSKSVGLWYLDPSTLEASGRVRSEKEVLDARKLGGEKSFAATIFLNPDRTVWKPKP
jgi:hypothetical protein